MDDNYFLILLKSDQKFFNIMDLGILWSKSNKIQIKNLIAYYKTKNKIFCIKRGVYSLIPLNKITKEDKLIIAQKIITPSYISYHTALSINGVNYQY